MGTKAKVSTPRVVIVDDQPEFRDFAREMLEGIVSLTVVGEAPEAESAFRLVEEVMPDIVLMDLDMPEMNGLEAIERLKDLFPEVQSVLVSIHDEDEYLPLALEAGAIDFIDKRKFTPQRVRRALALAS